MTSPVPRNAPRILLRAAGSARLGTRPREEREEEGGGRGRGGKEQDEDGAFPSCRPARCSSCSAKEKEIGTKEGKGKEKGRKIAYRGAALSSGALSSLSACTRVCLLDKNTYGGKRKGKSGGERGSDRTKTSVHTLIAVAIVLCPFYCTYRQGKSR